MFSNLFFFTLTNIEKYFPRIHFPRNSLFKKKLFSSKQTVLKKKVILSCIFLILSWYWCVCFLKQGCFFYRKKLRFILERFIQVILREKKKKEKKEWKSQSRNNPRIPRIRLSGSDALKSKSKDRIVPLSLTTSPSRDWPHQTFEFGLEAPFP
jgi:hypothetical protein